MKIVSTDALTKLIQLIKSNFISVNNTVTATTVELADVATTGDYDDLINTPTIPSEVTENTVSGWGFTKNAGTVTSVNNMSPVNGNVTLSIPSEVTENTVSGWGFTKNAGTITGITMNGTSKGTSGVVDLGTVITDISGKQDTLVSGTNIKTINSTSLLGSGNVAVQETLVSGTNIKTINSSSILGSGNIGVTQVVFEDWTVS